jgi:neutral ceramidase
VAGFAQGAAGDASPNYQHFPGLPGMRGRFADDWESARWHGLIQFERAELLWETAERSAPLEGGLDCHHWWVDLADCPVDPAFAAGETGVRTRPAAVGARMLAGTAEGGGLNGLAALAARGLAQLATAADGLARLPAAPAEGLARLLEAGRRPIFYEPGAGRVLGSDRLAALPLPEWLDPVIKQIKRLDAAGAIGPEPWSPHVLPVQIVVLGPLAIAAFPGEPTTQAGRRLRRTLEEALAPRGVTRVVLSGYANAYSGYVTTPEEYDQQAYEGASTHFGRWTLGAYQTYFRALARELCKPACERSQTGLRPAEFAPEALEKRCFERAQAINAS